MELRRPHKKKVQLVMTFVRKEVAGSSTPPPCEAHLATGKKRKEIGEER